MIKGYLKTAWRNLLHHKKMVGVNVAGLSIGMTATILILLWVQNELSFDKDQPESENIFLVKTKMVISDDESWVLENSQYLLGEHAAKEIPEIKIVTRLNPKQFEDIIFHYQDKLISEHKAAYVDEQWFNMFHYDFLEGSADSFLKNPFSLIITFATAEKYFGKQAAVGKVLRIDSVNYMVQAVVKDNPANSSFQFNVLIPIAAKLSTKEARDNDMDWGSLNYLTFIQLRPKADLNAVSAKLLKILNENTKDNKSTYSIVKLQDLHFENDILNSSLIHGNHKTVNIFIILSVVILITACINYVNLTTARAIMRSREISIRKIIGADRLDLFSQFMMESFLISLLALFFAVIFVELSLPWFKSFTDMKVSQPLFSETTGAIIGLTLIISFLLTGLYPAILLSSFDPLQAFKGKVLFNFKDSAFRKVLVITQFSISIILIIVTMVIYSQLKYIQNTDLGYDRSQIFTFTIPYKVLGFGSQKSEAILSTMQQELTKQHVISEVSIASQNIVDFKKQSSGSFYWPGKSKDFNPFFAPFQADHNFQHLMHLRLEEGRWFNASNSDTHNVVLNEAAVQLMHIQNPVIGQQFIHKGDTGVIIGIVKDFHYRNLHEKIGPMVISDEPGKASTFYIKSIAGEIPSAISVAKKMWEKFIPDEPFTYNFLDGEYDKLYKAEQQSYILIALFAGIAIFVSTLGLLGLSTFAAIQKTKEIGVRRILGASMQSIVKLLSVEFLKLVLIACIIAFPVAWWVTNKWLQSFSYRISLSWWIFILAAGVAFVITIVTINMQLIKIIAANPIKSLKAE
jgi:putative ABC transport system permease protein